MIPNRYRLFLLVSVVGVGLVTHSNGQEANKLAFFENHIRPLLSEHCFECHNAEKQEGGVRLDFRQAMIDGGDSGASIVPGKPEESLLIEAVRYETFEMPPDNPLPDEDVAKLVRWVREGAVWPPEETVAKPSLGDQQAIRHAADSHWAFQPIGAAELPDVSDPDWGKHRIDRLVLAKLDENGLRPSAPADRHTLIRRAFFDLLGLPPTPEVIRAVFDREDLSGLTYPQVVDGLLKSEHYGERMARHWMDVARYADTRDFLAAADLRYPFAYTYRDWLIHAFNQDMPFDDFIRHQLAADSLAAKDSDSNLAALGFLTVGPLFRNNQLELASDRIDVVTRGLMGLTGSCARCHDHKYDPISIGDYYALYGVFRDSIRPSEFPTIENPLGNEVNPELVRQFEKALKVEKDKLADYERELAENAMKDFRKRPSEYLIGYVEMNIDKSETTRGLKSKRKLEETALTPIAANLDDYRKGRRNASDPILGPLVSLLAADDKTFEEQKNKYLNSNGDQLHGEIRQAVAASRSRMELATHLGQAIQTALESDSEESKPIRDAVLGSDGPFQITPAAASRASRLLGKGRQTLLKFQQAIADVEATHPGAPDKAMTLVDAPQQRPVFVMYRGEPSRRGPEVSKRFPSYFSESDDETFDDGSGRLELAEKIVDSKNPLTARVIVNRIWRMHFGQGLVSDAGDFGLRSDAPAHGALLDDLAASLMENDWSLKWLHQHIMSSNTYRQASSAMNPPMRDDGTSAAEIDSANQLFWRQNRRRLDFESMRDSMLAAAGTLDLTIGGRSVKLSESPHPTRRSVYAYVDRVDPDPLFATFDVPSPDVCSAQRTETLVPQQALFAMNNPFVTEQARAMADRSDFQAVSTIEAKIGVLFDRTLQRDAKPNERAMVRRFLEQAEQLVSDRNPVWQYGYGPAEGSDELFSPLNYFDGKRYSYEREFPSATTGYAQLTRTGGHPGNSSAQSAIRRWTAPEDMLIRIAGTAERNSDRGDGIRCLVRIDGVPVFDETLQTGQMKTVAGYHQVKRGQRVDFVVDPGETPTSDGYRWTVLIESRDDSKQNVLSSWHSGRDFTGPPPPPMTPWEQVAQAFLMTNEFLFID